jgi:hypothetical protein
MMARAADAARSTIEGVNIFKPEAWLDPALEPYTAANRRAVQRGVSVTRVFIVADNIRTQQDLDNLLRVMQKQAEWGIHVKYALQEELRGMPFYGDHPFFSCALFDKTYFGWDLRTEIITGKYPAEIRISWDPEEIGEHNPFPSIYSYTHELGPLTRDSLLAYVYRANAAQ